MVCSSHHHLAQFSLGCMTGTPECRSRNTSILFWSTWFLAFLLRSNLGRLPFFLLCILIGLLLHLLVNGLLLVLAYLETRYHLMLRTLVFFHREETLYPIPCACASTGTRREGCEHRQLAFVRWIGLGRIEQHQGIPAVLPMFFRLLLGSTRRIANGTSAPVYLLSCWSCLGRRRLSLYQMRRGCCSTVQSGGSVG